LHKDQLTAPVEQPPFPSWDPVCGHTLPAEATSVPHQRKPLIRVVIVFTAQGVTLRAIEMCTEVAERVDCTRTS
jgi:hypothetical protein